jgi:hypothetical protein
MLSRLATHNTEYLCAQPVEHCVPTEVPRQLLQLHSQLIKSWNTFHRKNLSTEPLFLALHSFLLQQLIVVMNYGKYWPK